MANNVDDRLTKLEQKRESINAQIRRTKTMLSTQARKEDAHRKIVVGAAILAAVKTDAELKKTVARVLDDSVKNPRDREMLGLPLAQ